MSHDATAWARKQRGLKPAARVVLWELCDRFHPDHGCFPSQETLAADCEMSRSALNEHLEALERRGLIRREVRHSTGAHRRQSTRYRLAFEPGFEAGPEACEATKPCPESGHGAMSGKGPEPCPEKAQSHVRIPDTNLVSEPVREERECASAGAQGCEPEGASVPPSSDPPAGPVPDFDAFWKHWPNRATDNRGLARHVWEGLSADDRRGAVEGLRAWIAVVGKSGRTIKIAARTYLAERKWLEIDRPEGGAAQAFVPVAAWSREWWAVLFDRLRRRQPVAFTVKMACEGKPGAVKVSDMPTSAALSALIGVPANGRVVEAWRPWLKSRGVDLPPWKDAEFYVFLPGEDPAAYEAASDDRSGHGQGA